MSDPSSSSSSGSTSGPRRQARESALQALYLHDTCGEETGRKLPPTSWSEKPLAPRARAFAEHLVEGVLGAIGEIDPLLKKYTENWELKRMATVDRCILRLGAYELLYDVETPVNVVINEAVEIAKRYSTAQSGKFVNGILDKIKLERRL